MASEAYSRSSLAAFAAAGLGIGGSLLYALNPSEKDVWSRNDLVTFRSLLGADKSRGMIQALIFRRFGHFLGHNLRVSRQEKDNGTNRLGDS
jgi:hypothetical protein